MVSPSGDRTLSLRTVRTKTHKLTVDLRSGAGELYDLASDPEEVRNLLDSDVHRLSPGVLVSGAGLLRRCGAGPGTSARCAMRLESTRLPGWSHVGYRVDTEGLGSARFQWPSMPSWA